MRTYLFLLFLICIAVPVQAVDEHMSFFEKGNAFYEKGSYDEAIREYEKIPEQGIESGNLYFNLGNCYFRKGEIGKAILYYEKAKRLIPGDSDLQFNYTYAISKADSAGQQTSGAWPQKVTGVFGGLSVDGLTRLVSVLYLLIVILFIASLFMRIRKRYFIVSMGLLLLVFMSGAVSLYGRIRVLDREAIVVAKSPEAKFEPSDNATTYFPLTEGMKINIIDKKNGWIKIGRPDGKAGWVKKGLIEPY